MSNIAKISPIDIHCIDPKRITHPEPWQWEVLTEALVGDPSFKFWFGEGINKARVSKYMEAVVRGTLESNGYVFASPDCKVVLIWRWYGKELPDKRKQQMFQALGPDGTERYLRFREVTDMPIDVQERTNTVRPNYIGVLPQVQCRGYGSHILKWTLDYFDRQGYSTPFLMASTPRSAKLYGPLLGFYPYREVPLGENSKEVVVVMKRIGGGRPGNIIIQ